MRRSARRLYFGHSVLNSQSAPTMYLINTELSEDIVKKNSQIENNYPMDPPLQDGQSFLGVPPDPVKGHYMVLATFGTSAVNFLFFRVRDTIEVSIVYIFRGG